MSQGEYKNLHDKEYQVYIKITKLFSIISKNQGKKLHKDLLDKMGLEKKVTARRHTIDEVEKFQKAVEKQKTANLLRLDL